MPGPYSCYILFAFIAIELPTGEARHSQLFPAETQFGGQEVPYFAEGIFSTRLPEGKGTPHSEQTQVDGAFPDLVQIKVAEASLQEYITFPCMILTPVDGGFNLGQPGAHDEGHRHGRI
jgi:hypothetical protein